MSPDLDVLEGAASPAVLAALEELRADIASLTARVERLEEARG